MPWLNLAGAQLCGDLSYVNATFPLFDLGSSEALRSTNFGFAIPAGATINGIQVDMIIRESLAGVAEDTMLIVKAGVPGGVGHATFIEWPLVDTVRTFGGPADLWGLAWTPADINAAGFGVQFTIFDMTGAGPGGFVDCVQITVTFTPALVTSRGFLLRGVSPS